MLLKYAERFYERQYVTRQISSHQVLDRLEAILEDYFDLQVASGRGLPSVQDVALDLNLTPDYLTALLKNLTGQTTQQHIHQKLIEKAKVKLSSTRLSVSEIAYQLGYEHPQSFSKLFKAKTNQSPLEYRSGFD